MVKELKWQDFIKGQATARVDGGSAGVYYCNSIEEFRQAVYKIVMSNTSGLYEVEFLERLNGN